MLFIAENEFFLTFGKIEQANVIVDVQWPVWQ